MARVKSPSCTGHLSAKETQKYIRWQRRSAVAYREGQRDFKCPECNGWYWRQEVRGYEKEKSTVDQPEEVSREIQAGSS